MAVRILITGGTIDGLEYAREEDAPKGKRSIMPGIFRQSRVTAGYSAETVFFKDSRHITGEDRETLARACRSCREKRILITHGSMTAPATAKYLAKKKLGKTIVLTASILPAKNPRSDARFNLGYAFAAAQFLPAGVYVAMNGKVFPAGNVRKNPETYHFESER